MKRHSRRIAITALACMLLMLSACAPIISREKPLSRWDPEMRGQLSEQIAGNRSSEFLVFLAFSGGGTRAASFA